MGPGNGDNARARDEAPKGSLTTSGQEYREPAQRVEDSPLNVSQMDERSPVSAASEGKASNGLHPTLDAELGEIFPVRSNISARLVIDQGTPIVVLEDGARPLERYPLRNIRQGDPEPQSRYETDQATVQVQWTGTSIDINVKPHGTAAFLGRWVPLVGNQDEWIAFDRELHDPNYVTIDRPGENNSSTLKLFEA